MRSPTKSATAQLYKLRYSKTLLNIEILLIVQVYLALLLDWRLYDVLPAVIIISLLSFIFFMRFSIRVRFPHGFSVEYRTDPDRIICYYQGQQISYPLKQVDVNMTRWYVLLKLGHDRQAMQLALLPDSFEDNHYYSTFRRFLLSKSGE